MSAVADAFQKRLGKPAPPTSVEFHFPMEWDEITWEELAVEIGSGYFLDGFVYLFGPGLANYQKLLSHWSFLFSKEVEREVIGRNAYGALLVIEDATNQGTTAQIGVVDPLRVNYFTDSNLVFMNMIGNWLPQEKLPAFLDDKVYQQWKTKSNRRLELNEILAIKEPLSLGGAFDLRNFQVEEIEDYYQSTGAIYRKNRS